MWALGAGHGLGRQDIFLLKLSKIFYVKTVKTVKIF